MQQGDLISMVSKAESGDPKVREKLFVALYDELHRMASRELRRNVAVTISPTTLLHETFLNVSGRESAEFIDRQKFMAYAARAMRGERASSSSSHDSRASPSSSKAMSRWALSSCQDCCSCGLVTRRSVTSAHHCPTSGCSVIRSDATEVD